MLDELLQEWDVLTKDLAWQPHPKNKPQVKAYFSEAFETLYGGAAGGGKSDLLLGLARTMHGRSLLLRRTFPDLERSLISRSMEFYGDRRLYNSSKHIWNIDSRRIEFGHMEQIGTPQVPKDEVNYASAAYDLIGFDQLEQFPEYAYLFMLSRGRSAGKRHVRLIGSANPIGEGVEWIMKRWRAWLIEKTAKPGELLWYKMDKDNNDVQTVEGDPDAISRTFIPAGLKDNPYLDDNYRRSLMNITEPLRSALLNGDWSAMLTDDAYQVIPRSWVRAAMKRWKDEQPEGVPVIGVDVARGGDDKTVLAPRYDNWFARLQKHSGRSTPDGKSVTALIAIELKNGGKANIDVIGVGASAYDNSYDKGLSVGAVNFANASKAHDKSGTLEFLNLRAECYWLFREALDPDEGQDIALPPDDELEADLCAPRWSMQSRGIKIESKEDIKKRIGRSPDCGDAVVMAYFSKPAGKDLVDFA